jgi:tetratricopeptide (TPR) repeat protein
MLTLLFRFLLAFIAIAACACSLVSARAISLFKQGDPASLSSAARLVPVNAEYWSALGAVETARSEVLWKEALALNPFNSQLWIQLGFYTESGKHQLPEAEQMYRQATRVNHMYLPSSNLANFYFRYHDQPRFLQAAKKALAVSPFNNNVLFFQAWTLAGSNQQVMDLLPPRNEVAFDYLHYLLDADQTDSLEAAAGKALDLPRRIPADSPELASNWVNLVGLAEDHLVMAGRPEAALRLWKKSYESGWTKLPAPSPSLPLTNASFQSALSSHGFDWFFLPAAGVSFDQLPESRQVRLSFSGTEPEWCRLLQQYVPLAPGKTYQMKWQTESSDFDHPIGLTWKMYPVRSGKVDIESMVSSPDLIAEPNGSQLWKFSSPPDANFGLMALEFKRPVGQVRAEGMLSIHDVELLPVSASAP